MNPFPTPLSVTFRACLAAVAISLSAGCRTPSDPSPTASATAMDGPGNAPSLGVTPVSAGPTTGGATSAGGSAVPTSTTGR